MSIHGGYEEKARDLIVVPQYDDDISGKNGNPRKATCIQYMGTFSRGDMHMQCGQPTRTVLSLPWQPGPSQGDSWWAMQAPFQRQVQRSVMGQTSTQTHKGATHFDSCSDNWPAESVLSIRSQLALIQQAQRRQSGKSRPAASHDQHIREVAMVIWVQAPDVGGVAMLQCQTSR